LKANAKNKKVKSATETETMKSERVLLEPEEWKDPAWWRVIGEYHKKSPSESLEENETQDGTDEKKQIDAHIAGDSSKHQSLATQVFDLSTIEVMSFTIFRALFGRSVRVPLKLDGVIDMDIAVENTDVVLNTNCVAFIPPQLQIWRFIFTYKQRAKIRKRLKR